MTPCDIEGRSAGPLLSRPATRRPGQTRRSVAGAVLALALGLALTATVSHPEAAHAQDAPPTPPIEAPAPPEIPTPEAPAPPEATPADPSAGASAGGGATLDIDLNTGEKPSKSIVIILVLTVLSVAPSLLVLLTPFTRIVVVLSLARNALGVATVPPNQVLVGIALFLSAFTMAPTLKQLNDVALQPLLNDQMSEQQAWDAAMVPLRAHLLENTRKEELAIFVDHAAANGGTRPEQPADVEMTSLVPAYVLSELRSAFIIGFVIFIPFLVIDLVVSAVLMSLGMMMLPPVVVSLPFKILLFVMVGGWSLVVETLLRSFN